MDHKREEQGGWISNLGDNRRFGLRSHDGPVEVSSIARMHIDDRLQPERGALLILMVGYEHRMPNVILHQGSQSSITEAR